MRKQYESMLMTVMHNSDLVRESLDPSMTMGQGQCAHPEPAITPDPALQQHPEVGSRRLVVALLRLLVSVGLWSR